MQILQRLFSIPAQEHPRSIVSNSSPTPRKEGNKDQNSKSKNTVVISAGGKREYKRSESVKLKCENLCLFRFLQRKDVSKSFFYHTLNLRRVGSFVRRRQSAKMTKEEGSRRLEASNKAVSATKVEASRRLEAPNKAESGTTKVEASRRLEVPNKAKSATRVEASRRLEAPNKAESTIHHVGNKVLPISDSAQSSEKKEKTKGEKNKAVSRMRELMKWAAFTKEGKYRLRRKVVNLKSVGGLKDDDEFTTDSPKISFRWEVDSCSTTSSVYSSISKASSAFKNDQIHVRNHCADGIYGSWITTDSEFVVLEL